MIRALALALGTVAAAAAIAGCSSSGSSPSTSSSTSPSAAPSVVDGITIPPVYEPPSATVVAGPSSCPAAFRSALESATSHGSFSLQSEHDSHLLTCTYQDAKASASECSKATVRVNTEPQAFMAFDRWNVETGQNSMWGDKPKLQPVPLSGIGIVAEWVPALHELGTASATTWVSVFVSCPGEPQDVPALAKTLARAGLASSA